MTHSHRPPTAVAVALLALGLVLSSGCASKKYVQGEVVTSADRLGQRIIDVEGQVEQTHTRLVAHDQQLGELSRTAREALDRAVAAGKLAEGKLLYETILTDEDVRFGFDAAALGEQATAALDAFAAEVRQGPADVYIEIQGHTDATGTDRYNERLGLRRAEEVERYLRIEQGLPLHRMSVISYGESLPIADNGTPDGRAQNRRVALVVLR